MNFRFYAFKLCGVILLVFFAQLLINWFTELFLLDQSALSEPWRFVTSIFLHGGLAHLVYNLFALALFGSILESLKGGPKLLAVFFVSGILANFVSVNFYDASLGASGAIFGIIGCLVVIRPWLPVFAFGLPMPIVIAGALWAAGDVMGIFIDNGVANIAHLSGMFFGALIGFIFRDKKMAYMEKGKNRRGGWQGRKKEAVSEEEVRRWEERWMLS